jgi:ankyrin repeat protein
VLVVSVHAKEYEHWEPQTLLAATAASGKAEAVAKRVEAGDDVNEVDSVGRTALMWSCICTSPSVARTLLQAGARVDLMDEEGYTALHLACKRTSEYTPPCDTCTVLDVDLVRMLIDAGSDVNARADPNRMTPLHAALSGPGQSVDIVAALLQAGADPNAVYASWAPVNQVAAHARWDPSVIKLFDMLVAAGAHPNHSHYLYGPPIVQAVEAGKIDFVRYLINLGVDLNTVVVAEVDGRREEYTALDVAVESNLVDIKNLLESAGAVSASDLIE